MSWVMFAPPTPLSVFSVSRWFILIDALKHWTHLTLNPIAGSLRRPGPPRGRYTPPMVDAPTPMPPRYRWLKRFAVFGAVMLLLVGALRAYWGHVMTSRLAAAEAQIRDRGEPIRLNDLSWKAPPAQDNSATYLKQALSQWPRVNGKRLDQTDWHSEPEKFADPVDDNAAYLKRCEPMLALLRKAERAPEADWGVQRKRPGMSIRLNYLGQTRHLAELVGDAARRAHEVGNDRLALKLIDHQFTIADSLDTSPRMLVTYLVQASVRAMAINQLEAMSFELRVAPDAPKAATPDQLRGLIGRLVDATHQRREFARGMLEERVMMYDMLRARFDGQVPGLYRLSDWPLSEAPSWVNALLAKPLLQQGALVALKELTAYVRAAQHAETYREHNRIWHKHKPSKEPARSWLMAHAEVGLWKPAFQAGVVTSFQSRARRDMAGVALAIRLYQVDLNGQRPDTLAELVPEYLDEVPDDPFAKSDQPIGYKPRGARPVLDPDRRAANQSQPKKTNRPRLLLLYSVGQDQQDDHGQVRVDQSGKIASSARYDEHADIFFLLEPEPKPRSQTSTPATQPK